MLSQEPPLFLEVRRRSSAYVQPAAATCHQKMRSSTFLEPS